MALPANTYTLVRCLRNSVERLLSKGTVVVENNMGSKKSANTFFITNLVEGLELGLKRRWQNAPVLNNWSSLQSKTQVFFLQKDHANPVDQE